MVARVTNKSFEQWLYEDVEQAFGLTRLFVHLFFDNMKEQKVNLTFTQDEQLEHFAPKK